MSNNPFKPPVQTGQPTGNDPGKPLRVAIAQRRVMYALLAGIGLNVSASYLSTLGSAMQVVTIFMALVVIGLMAYVMYSLAKELNSDSIAIVYAVLMIVPCLSLILLVIVSQQATNYLKQFGIKVGLMGANLKQFKK